MLRLHCFPLSENGLALFGSTISMLKAVTGPKPPRKFGDEEIDNHRAEKPAVFLQER